MFSRGLAFLEKSSYLTSLTLLRLLVRSYKSITNLSMTSKYVSSISSGNISIALRTGVSSGNTFHTSQAEKRNCFAPCKWVKHRQHTCFLRPRDAAMVCAGRYRTCLEEPNEIHNSSNWRVGAMETARTTTSVSLLGIFTRQWP